MLVQHFDSIGREVKFFKLLMLQLFLLHIDDFGEEVVIGERVIIKHIRHFLLYCLVHLDLLLAK